MNLLIKTMIIVAFFCMLNTVSAQAEPQYTQYMYNTISINPGYAGTKGKLEAILLHRSQWVGLDGSPKTQSLGLHKRVKNNIGLGLHALNDNLGPSNKILVNGDLAYQIRLNRTLNLSMGINAGIDVLNIDYSKGTFFDANDPIFAENVNTLRPVLGSGLYLYSNNWYVGLSASNFFNSNVYNDEERLITDRKTQYYGIAGYVFDISNAVRFKPALLTKLVSGAPISFDVSANFLFDNKITAGLAYRNEDAISALVGFQINPKFFVGYSYDYSTSGLSNFNSGSHELLLRYSIFNKNNRALSPRFF